MLGSLSFIPHSEITVFNNNCFIWRVLSTKAKSSSDKNCTVIISIESD